MMNQNPEALYQLLGAGGGEGDEEEDFMGPQVMQVDLTQEEAAAVERVSLSLYLELILSSRHWGSIVRWSCKHICYVTRTKSSLQTFCSRTARMTCNVLAR
jgi:hypothetical protein